MQAWSLNLHWLVLNGSVFLRAAVAGAPPSSTTFTLSSFGTAPLFKFLVMILARSPLGVASVKIVRLKTASQANGIVILQPQAILLSSNITFYLQFLDVNNLVLFFSNQTIQF